MAATPFIADIEAWLALRSAADAASSAANEAKRALEFAMRAATDLLPGALAHDTPTVTVWWRKMKKSENVTLHLLRKELTEEMAAQIWSHRHSTEAPCLVVERKESAAVKRPAKAAKTAKTARAEAEGGESSSPRASAKRPKKTKQAAGEEPVSEVA